ncbi:MAG TPA: hypothetical protein VLC95_19550 [Anaerolineae bacterium]|nr:hypothetical protein [Anaerolineae bacterium]
MIVPAHIAAERPFARAVAGVLARLWLEHGRALLVYLLLSLALTWPLARAFQSALIGVGDTRQLLWLLWHTKEALLGNDPLLSTGLLYYPHGSTLLANALGPLLGLPAGTRFVTLTLATAPPETHAINMQIERLALRTSGMPFPPPDFVVNGQFQRDPAEPLIAVHGSGWYAPEGEAWRWASSPAEVWVHSSRPRQVRLLLLPVAVHDPGGEKGLGSAGTVVVSANAGEAQTLDCVVGRQAEIDLTMAAGWNRVSLALSAGNFCPAEVEPGNGDRRELAFAFARLELYGE